MMAVLFTNIVFEDTGGNSFFYGKAVAKAVSSPVNSYADAENNHKEPWSEY
jgi:hypothetical protein